MPHAQPLAEEELRRPHSHRRVNLAEPAEQLHGGDRLDHAGVEQVGVGPSAGLDIARPPLALPPTRRASPEGDLHIVDR